MYKKCPLFSNLTNFQKSCILFTGGYIMDYSQIVQLIGSLGFPIARCIVMVVFFYKIITQIESTHKENLEKITEALDNNTRIINELKQSLDNVLK